MSVPTHPKDFHPSRNGILVCQKYRADSKSAVLVSAAFLCTTGLLGVRSLAADLERLQYNNPGLVVDLEVGLWGLATPDGL